MKLSSKLGKTKGKYPNIKWDFYYPSISFNDPCVNLAYYVCTCDWKGDRTDYEYYQIYIKVNRREQLLCPSCLKRVDLVVVTNPFDRHIVCRTLEKVKKFFKTNLMD